MATAGSIVVDLLMRTGSFETDTKRAEQRLRQMQKSVDKFGKQVALVGAATAAAFGLAMKSATSYMVEIGNAAQRTSVSAKSFSELSFAAERASLSQGELERVLRRSTEAINYGIAGTGKQADALQALGVSARDSAGNIKTADQMLKDLAEQFSKLRPGAEKTKLALDLFGQQLGQKVVPLLNQGADGLDKMAQRAHELGLVIDDEAAQAAIDFEDNLNDLSKAAKGFAISITKDVIPALTGLINQFNLAKQSGNLFGWFFTSGSEAANPEAEIKKIDESLVKLRGTLKTFEDAGKSSSFMRWWNKDDVAIIEAQIAGMEKRRAFLQSLLNQGGRSSQMLEPIITAGDGGGGSTTRTKTEIDAGQRLIDQMIERIALIGKETEYEQLLARIGVESIEFRTKADQTQALALADLFDKRSAQIEQEKTIGDLMFRQGVVAKQYARELEGLGKGTWNRELIQKIGAIEDKWTDLIEQRRNSIYGLTSTELAAYEDMMATEIQMAEEHYATLKEKQDDWLLGITEGLKNYADEAQNTYQQSSDAFKRLFGDVEDMLVNGEFNWKKFADSVIKEITRIYVRSQILGPIAQMISGGGDMGFGMLGSLFGGGNSIAGFTGFGDGSISLGAPYIFGSAKGNVFDAGSGLDPYLNTIVSSPTLFRFAKGGAFVGLMGESGDEAVVPLRRGADGTLGVQVHGDSARDSRPVMVVNNFNISTPNPDAFRRSQDQIQRQMGIAAQRAIVRA